MFESESVRPDWPFSAAADVWFRAQEDHLKPNTLRSYAVNLKPLRQFFGETRLDAISIGHIRAYQKWRKDRAGSTLINSEISRLQSIMKEAGLWHRVGQQYKPLPQKHEKVRRNMSAEEEQRFYAACLRPGKTLAAGHCLIVMANTTMGFWELSHLRRMDIVLDGELPRVTVAAEAGGAKNSVRERTIPLNARAYQSLKWLVERWEMAGGNDPRQYVLYHRASAGSAPDFWTPQRHIYKAARKIFEAAGLTEMTPYDMRSHAITKLLSNPKVSDQVAQEIAGHISKKMQDRYSSQRLENKKAALDALL